MSYYPSEVRLRRLLAVLVPLFLFAAVLYALAPVGELGPVANPFAALSRELPFVSDSVVKVTLIMLCCLFAAGDVRRRRGLVVIVILAHVVSVLAMGLLLALGAASGQVLVGGRSVDVTDLLWGAIGLDGVILAVVTIVLVTARRDAAVTRLADETGQLTPAERRLRFVIYLLSLLFLLAAVGYEVGVLLPSTSGFFVELPFVTNSVVKVATLGFLCLYAAREFRRNMPVVGIVIVAHFVSLVAMAQFFVLVPARTTEMVTVWGGVALPMSQVLAGAMVLDGVIGLGLLLLYLAAWRARYQLQLLQPIEFRTLIALADVLVKGDDEVLPGIEVAHNVERYVREIRVKRRWVYRVSLFAMQYHPVLYLKAPMSELDPVQRELHLRKHFERDVLLPAIPEWWHRLVQALIRVSKQLTYVGYYSDSRTFASVGYRPFSERAVGQGGTLPPKASVGLTVLEAAEVGEDDPRLRDYDVCIIGSGAGGSILAHGLAERGKTVLLVERGKYVPPDQFSEDEVEMIKRLYAEGVFQQTEDFRFTILQGSCVGGSTVVNNAVCFDPPGDILDGWNDPEGNDAGLDRHALAMSLQQVRQLISVQRQPPEILNPSGKPILGAVKPGDNLDYNIVEANIEDCLGCGYCNIGCAYGRKLSMLDRVLPEAQKRFPGKVTILANAPVTRLLTDGRRPARVVAARAAVGEVGRERILTLRAESFVVSAGTIASSYLLMRSGIGRDLPVGRRMSFNMGAPITAEWPNRLNAYAGLQISHYLAPITPRGFVAETWFNPPVAQALNMPGWFEDHYENMKRFAFMGAIGVLVGTEGTAYLRQALTGGPGVVYTPSQRDLNKLADGLAQMAELLFRSGAVRVMLNTWRYDVLTRPNQIPDIYRIVRDSQSMTLGTGHPQGGNAISRNPQWGVVDDNFRVHGYTNLHVCDASVFPTSITVNPQLTVMTLARYAAGRI